MGELCIIPTTTERGPGMASAHEARKWIENHINPDLKRCGELPGCRRCGIRFEVEVMQVAERVVARRTRVGNLT